MRGAFIDAHLRCRLRAPVGAPPARYSLARLIVEDVSLADSAAKPIEVTRVALRSIADLAGPHDVRARLRPGRSYALRIHVSQSGSASIIPGDLISTTSNPVPVRPETADVEVQLTAVAPSPSTT